MVEDHRIRLVVDDSTASYPITVDPVVEEVKFTGSDTAAGDQFGLAVAAVGSNVLIGAPGAGQVFLFDGTTGALLLTLTAPTAEAGNQFGYAVTAMGANILVGAPGAGSPGGTPNAGQAFLLDGGTGAPLRTFVKPTPTAGDRLGTTLAALGADVLVGAPGDRSAGEVAAGAAYLFDGKSGTVLETFTKPRPAPGDQFGSAVTAGFTPSPPPWMTVIGRQVL